jgi:A/G-specific adenine glycosylase
MKLSEAARRQFQMEVTEFYLHNGRHELPWRQVDVHGQLEPYDVLVSEIMLQQTQVNRVVPKFVEFVARFPDVQSLASAELADVLVAWQGLGYNRRAKFLWQAAQMVAHDWHGDWPRTVPGLVALPGVGSNTAGAIVTYAYNQPAVFVETNIRSVYFHHFFPGQTSVTDAQITELVEQTMDRANPREFYWALMDYGTHLKQLGHGSISQSKHYTKQSKFEGSVRQVRGKVLRLLSQGPVAATTLLEQLEDARAPRVLQQLTKEGLIRLDAGQYRLA